MHRYFRAILAGAVIGAGIGIASFILHQDDTSNLSDDATSEG